MTSALRVSGLRFSYPDGTAVLDGIDFDLAWGERVALLGPNGAGKTTLLLHLIGVLTAGEGRIEVGEMQLEPATLYEVRKRVGLVFQDPDDQLFMPTVRQDVAFGPANYGLKGEELDGRVQTALEEVDSSELADRAPHHLSGGERRRVAIATVLAVRPQVLVLDEPTANLDPAGRRELAELLETIETTQLIVTHDLPFALRLCPRSMIMNDGRIIADGPTAGLLADTTLMAANRLELPHGFELSGA